MKKSRLPIVLPAVFMLILCSINAQLPLDISNIKKNNFYYISDVSVYSDKNKLSIDSILKIDNGLFKNNPNTKTYNASSSDRYNWFRFKLKNASADPVSVKFINGNNQVNEMELFQLLKDSVFSMGVAGRIYPFSKRPYPFLHYTFPVTLKPHEETTYLFYADCRGISYRIMLFVFSDEYFKSAEQKIYLTYGIFIGVLLLSSLFNLFLYALNREKIHFAYSLYSLFIILLLSSLQSLDVQFLYPDLPLYTRSTISTYTCVTTALLIWVMQLFLKQSKSNSRFYSMANYLKWLCLIFPVPGFYISNLSSSVGLIKIYLLLYPLTILLAFAIVIVCSIEKLIQGYSLAIFYLTAVSLTLISGSIMTYGLLQRKYYLSMPPTFLDISMVAEALIICFGILYRYILIKKEKDKLEKTLQEQQLSVSSQIILSQEEERKRIAADLHDELGGNLAAIKMNILSMPLAEEKIAGIVNLIDAASENARSISHDLMPPEFENTKLNDLLMAYFEKLNKTGKTNFVFHCSGSIVSFTKLDDLMVYRIIMELTNNIIKHAEATLATVQLIYYDSYLELMAEDNGRGFDRNSTDGIGLKNVQSRVSYLNGKLTIDSVGKGTTIIIQVPYKNTLNEKAS